MLCFEEPASVHRQGTSISRARPEEPQISGNIVVHSSGSLQEEVRTPKAKPNWGKMLDVHTLGVQKTTKKQKKNEENDEIGRIFIPRAVNDTKEIR